MQKGIVYNIMKYALQDGPGIRTTVFLKGCPLSCWWCHNPESQDVEGEIIYNQDKCISCEACITTNCHSCIKCGFCATVCVTGAKEMIGSEMTVGEVMKEIEKDLIFYEESGGGVTFSGGEPLMQLDFLLEILKACKAKDINTVVDTTGYGPFKALQKIAPYTDLFLYDLKHIKDSSHTEYTGVSNTTILDNLTALTKIHNSIYIRIPIVPGINDDEESIKGFAEFLKGMYNIQGIQLLPYHDIAIEKYKRLKKEYKLIDIKPPTEEAMMQLKEKFKNYGINVKIGGGF